MIIPMGFGSFSGIAATFELLGLEQRSLPMPLIGKRVDETITLELPLEFKPTALPRDAHLKWAHGYYQSTTSLVGSRLTVRRELELNAPGPLLSPQDYPEFRVFGQAVMRELRAQVVY